MPDTPKKPADKHADYDDYLPPLQPVITCSYSRGAVAYPDTIYQAAYYDARGEYTPAFVYEPPLSPGIFNKCEKAKAKTAKREMQYFNVVLVRDDRGQRGWRKAAGLLRWVERVCRGEEAGLLTWAEKTRRGGYLNGHNDNLNDTSPTEP